MRFDPVAVQWGKEYIFMATLWQLIFIQWLLCKQEKSNFLAIAATVALSKEKLHEKLESYRYKLLLIKVG